MLDGEIVDESVLGADVQFYLARQLFPYTIYNVKVQAFDDRGLEASSNLDWTTTQTRE